MQIRIYESGDVWRCAVEDIVVGEGQTPALALRDAVRYYVNDARSWLRVQRTSSVCRSLARKSLEVAHILRNR